MHKMNLKRIESIDIIRGLAMVLMALDHTRDYFHIGANLDNPLNLETTTPLLFFTRWITHFCAPVFVFLSGTSIYLQSLRKSKKELGMFLIKRGLWLILIEWTIVAFAWTFNPNFNLIPFQVIWAIGISMFLIGLMMLVNMHYKAILFLGLIIVAGHNILDYFEKDFQAIPSFLWDFIHYGSFTPRPISDKISIIIAYPFVPWTGLMMLGYCIGKLFGPEFNSEHRKKILLRLGLSLIALFAILRGINLYGDPMPWEKQDDLLFTFFSFINVWKYPPSLLYMCITIGPSLLLLAYVEGIKNKLSDALVVFGRTAFFYYILHLYTLHFLAMIVYFVRGHEFSYLDPSGKPMQFLFVIPGEGYNLAGVYLVWFLVVIGLYKICQRYDQYKILHREKWWLSYL